MKRFVQTAALAFSLALVANAACGVSGLSPPLPDQIEGFSLTELAEIQNDSSLTDDERRQMIRDATGAPDNADGDLLVNFLLTLVTP